MDDADAYLHEIITAFSMRAAQLSILFLAVFMALCLPMLVSSRLRAIGGLWICCSVAALYLLRVAWEVVPGALRMVVYWRNVRKTKAQQAARAKRIRLRRMSSGMQKIHAVTAGEKDSTPSLGSSPEKLAGAGGTLHKMREASLDTGTKFNFTQSDRSITGITPDASPGMTTRRSVDYLSISRSHPAAQPPSYDALMHTSH